MKKIALVSLLVMSATSTFAADTAIFNMTKFPMQVTYYTCTEVPNVGTQCDAVPVQETVNINPQDGNGKNYKMIPLADRQQIIVDKVVIRDGSKLTSYSLDCADMVGGAIIINDMGGTPALVCQYASTYAMPAE